MDNANQNAKVGVGPLRPEQARSIERRAQVLAAALQLLLGGGSATVTHRRVAEASESSPGAVRYYFSTRDDLLAACLDQLESTRSLAAEQVLHNLGEANPTPEQAAFLALRIYFGDDLDDATVTGTIWSIVDCSRESARLATLLATHRQAAQADLEQLLSRCDYPTITPSLVTAVLDGSVLPTTFERGTAATKSAVTELADLFRLTLRN